jgi:DMSO reductase family type II enzyme heme b subunit
VLCHGEEGDGLGPAAERLNPPPRDFTAGTYKIKTTGFDDMVPNDDDIFRMINDGMAPTAMPGWGDVLSVQEIWDTVAYIKTFSGYDEEAPSDQLDYGEQIASSPESVAKGDALFHDQDRCTECHGKDGKGNAGKRLKDDNGARTWPRNLTKPWSFRASNDPRDIFTRISIGIPGTQMPAFSDPASKKKLSIEERWHLANYVQSLANDELRVRAENTVIKAEKIDGEAPDTPDDPRWSTAQPTSFDLIPQIIAEQRFFTPSNDSITVRALYSVDELAVLVQWDDRTQSIPGVDRAAKISDPELSEDAVAVQLPIAGLGRVEKPYFGMGDAAHPVNIWHWKSGTTDRPESISLLNAKGFTDIENRDAAASGFVATGVYDEGTWRVVMKRPLTTDTPEADLQFEIGKFIPIAFAAWDGSNSEHGSRHTMTTWYWLLLTPSTGSKPLMAGVAVAVLMFGLLVFWAHSAQPRRG